MADAQRPTTVIGLRLKGSEPACALCGAPRPAHHDRCPVLAWPHDRPVGARERPSSPRLASATRWTAWAAGIAIILLAYALLGVWAIVIVIAANFIGVVEGAATEHLRQRKHTPTPRIARHRRDPMQVDGQR